MKKMMMAAAALMLLAGWASAAGKKTAPTLMEMMQSAYDGESNAKARYEAFAAKAEQEGYLGAAGLFRAAAMSEGIHAAKHAKAITDMGGAPKADVKAPEVKGTKENLKAALAGETREAKSMYPEYLAKAQAEKNMAAVYSFKGALAAEKMHMQYFAKALADLKGWKARKKFLVCQVCGYTTMDLKIKVCPVCSSPRDKFTEVE